MLTGRLAKTETTQTSPQRTKQVVIYSFFEQCVQKILYPEYKACRKNLSFYKVTCSTITYSKGKKVIAGTSFKNDNNKGRDLRSSDISRSVEWLFHTGVSGPVG